MNFKKQQIPEHTGVNTSKSHIVLPSFPSPVHILAVSIPGQFLPALG